MYVSEVNQITTLQLKILYGIRAIESLSTLPNNSPKCLQLLLFLLLHPNSLPTRTLIAHYQFIIQMVQAFLLLLLLLLMALLHLMQHINSQQIQSEQLLYRLDELKQLVLHMANLRVNQVIFFLLPHILPHGSQTVRPLIASQFCIIIIILHIYPSLLFIQYCHLTFFLLWCVVT